MSKIYLEMLPYSLRLQKGNCGWHEIIGTLERNGPTVRTKWCWLFLYKDQTKPTPIPSKRFCRCSWCGVWIELNIPPFCFVGHQWVLPLHLYHASEWHGLRVISLEVNDSNSPQGISSCYSYFPVPSTLCCNRHHGTQPQNNC